MDMGPGPGTSGGGTITGKGYISQVEKGKLSTQK